MMIMIIHHHESVGRPEIPNDVAIVSIFMTERDHAEIVDIACQWCSVGVMSE